MGKGSRSKRKFLCASPLLGASAVKLCLAAVVLLALPAAAQEEQKTKTVKVRGVAEGTDAGAHDNAVLDALRKAVEQGVGTFIQSQTEVENYEVIYDKIVSNTEGYICEYEVEKSGHENKDNPRKARTWVQIKAMVKLGELKDDWRQLAILIKRKGNPRIMVIVRDKISGTVRSTGTDRVTVDLERFFLDKGLAVVDRTTIEKNKLNETKAASVEGNLAKVAALGKEHRAHLIVIGCAETSLLKASSPYGAGTWYYHSGSMAVRVVNTDNASVVFTMALPAGKDTVASDRSNAEAANKTLSKVAKAAGPKILTGIMKAWNKDIIIGSEITVTIQGLSYGALRKLVKKIEEFRFVSEIIRDDFSNRIAKLRVKTRLSSHKLTDEMIDSEVCKEFQIIGVQKDSVEIDLNKTKE